MSRRHPLEKPVEVLQELISSVCTRRSDEPERGCSAIVGCEYGLLYYFGHVVNIALRTAEDVVC